MAGPFPFRSSLATLLSIALVSTSVSACKPKRIEPEPEAEVKTDDDDANRFAALRVDGTVSYLWQSLIIPTGYAPEIKNDASIHQCWYRYDTPPGEHMATEGTDNFELFKKYADKAVNVNAFSVPTDVLAATFEQLHLDVYAKDEQGAQADISNGGITGVLEYLKVEEFDAVFSSIVAAETAVEEEMKSEDAVREPILIEDGATGGQTIILPQNAFECPAASAMAAMQAEQVPINPQAMQSARNQVGTGAAGTQLTADGEQSYAFVGAAIGAGAWLLRAGAVAVRAAPTLLTKGTRVAQTVSSAVRFVPKAVKPISRLASKGGGKVATYAANRFKEIAAGGRYVAGRVSAVRGAVSSLRSKAALSAAKAIPKDDLILLAKAGRISGQDLSKVVAAQGNFSKPFSVVVNGATKTVSNPQQLKNLVLQIQRQGVRSNILQQASNAGNLARQGVLNNPFVKAMSGPFNVAMNVWAGWEVKKMWDDHQASKQATSSSQTPKTGTSPSTNTVVGSAPESPTENVQMVLNNYTSPNAARGDRARALMRMESNYALMKTSGQTTSESDAQIKEAREIAASYYEGVCPQTAARIRSGEGGSAIVGTNAKDGKPAVEGCPH